MKNILLLLLALIVVPAWAGDVTVASSTPQPSSQATQIVPETKSDSGWLKFLINDSSAGTLSCQTGCTLMNCPPPSGPVVCCHKTAQGYQAC